MEIAIGEIIDRYSICRLKSERGGIDMSDEMNQLSAEMNKFEGLEQYAEELYVINGNIWTLESDIRKGNEAILGLEEVGRRAIKIREFNNERIKVKNIINSKTKTGFVETKIAHGSEKEPSLVISLTTVPDRLIIDSDNGVKATIISLCEQIDNDYEVHFNVPETYKPTGEPYVIPQWLNELKLKYPHLKIYRPEDMGPPTKIVPTLMRLKNPETIILVVDDDLIYHNEMVIEHRKFQNRLPNSVISYEGRGVVNVLYNNHLRDSWIICTTVIREITELIQHYKSASYKRKLFDMDFFNNYVGRTLSDDILVSKYFKNKKIKMYVVPYEKESHLYETDELWQKNQGVETFPIVGRTVSPLNSGCNNPKLLDIQPKFYDPGDLGKVVDTAVKVNIQLDLPDSERFKTDKYYHGYISFYDEEFKILNNCKNVLEIGIWKGESLRWLSYKFPDATIYGIDSIDCKDVDNEKIKTYKLVQENREQMEKFIKETNILFDLIIDDGGHNMEQQQTTFGMLFNRVKPGGIYVIEDLHTSNWEMYNKPEDLISSLDMLNKLKSEGVVISKYITESEKKYIQENVESIKIWTRTPTYSESVTSIIKKKEIEVILEETKYVESDFIRIWDNDIVAGHVNSEIERIIKYLNDIHLGTINYVDIGANVGKYYDILSKHFKIENAVMTEPVVDLYQYMVNKFKGRDNCKIYNYAVSDYTGKADLNTGVIDFYKNNDNYTSINLGLSKINKIDGDVVVVSGYDFLNKFASDIEIDLIKIDTETQDYFILKSITSYIKILPRKPLIVFENNYHNDMTYDEAKHIYETFMSECEYNGYNFDLLGGEVYLIPKNWYNI